jgi:hypothetical protein
LFELLDLFILPVVLELLWLFRVLRLLDLRCSTDRDPSCLRTTFWL